MKKTEAVVPALVLLALLLGAVGTAGAATPGYAVYSVQLSSMGVVHRITVNASVAATSNVGYDKLMLGIVSGGSDFNYSRSINSSLNISPFLPSVSNQTFRYASNGTSVSLNVAKNGTVPVQFHGGSYQLTSYALSAQIVTNGTSKAISGGLLTFPSGLIYSVRVSAPLPDVQGLGAKGVVMPGYGTGADPFQSLAGLPSGTISLSFTLLSTSLPLTGPSSSATEQAASIGIGAGAVVSVLALALGVQYKRKHEPEAQTKPEYAVD
ncbi:MAG: hypothetical protein OK474_07645 [Thaumarchaeota archaeon]|nr:hypothetical protein [Nitrososphaerota archaeon]